MVSHLELKKYAEITHDRLANVLAIISVLVIGYSLQGMQFILTHQRRVRE